MGNGGIWLRTCIILSRNSDPEEEFLVERLECFQIRSACANESSQNFYPLKRLCCLLNGQYQNHAYEKDNRVIN
jgi:hypothetical protein